MNDALEAHTARRPTTHRPRLVGTRRCAARCGSLMSISSDEVNYLVPALQSPVSRIRAYTFGSPARSFRRRPSLASSAPAQRALVSFLQKGLGALLGLAQPERRVVYLGVILVLTSAHGAVSARRSAASAVSARSSALARHEARHQTRSTRPRRAGGERRGRRLDSRARPPGHPRRQSRASKTDARDPRPPARPRAPRPADRRPDPIAAPDEDDRLLVRRPHRAAGWHGRGQQLLHADELGPLLRVRSPWRSLKTIVKTKRNMTDAEREAARAATRTAGEARAAAAEADAMEVDGAAANGTGGDDVALVPRDAVTVLEAHIARCSPRAWSPAATHASRPAAATRRRACGRCRLGRAAATPPPRRRAPLVLRHEARDGKKGDEGEGEGAVDIDAKKEKRACQG